MSGPAEGTTGPTGDPLSILVVCTGNIARSPMGAAVLRQELGFRGIVAEVGSAGFVTEGREADPHAVRLVDKHRDLDLSGHRSRRIGPDLLDASDLVLTMERQHVRQIADLDATALPRTFTVVELARLARPRRPRAPGEPLADWLEVVAAGRRRTDVISHTTEDDVPDPYKRGRRAFRKAYEAIDAALETIVRQGFTAG